MQMKIYLDSVQIGSFSGLVQSPPDPTFRTKHSCTISRACQVLFLSAGSLSRNVIRTILPDNLKENRRDPKLKYLIRAISA